MIKQIRVIICMQFRSLSMKCCSWDSYENGVARFGKITYTHTFLARPTRNPKVEDLVQIKGDIMWAGVVAYRLGRWSSSIYCSHDAWSALFPLVHQTTVNCKYVLKTAFKCQPVALLISRQWSFAAKVMKTRHFARSFSALCGTRIIVILGLCTERISGLVTLLPTS